MFTVNWINTLTIKSILFWKCGDDQISLNASSRENQLLYICS
ncbi:hypothetical protein E2C01_055368 [Portunus trituberculatus]|uniref:Uncharacterized protein n=1 Tax=Portunus trituberculatus TaxID=210409 RepID=A0A5B7GUT0_PORTR|nr:hypothetical protein [Portunus trituberculatus]